jgi:hypothetical protein
MEGQQSTDANVTSQADAGISSITESATFMPVTTEAVSTMDMPVVHQQQDTKAPETDTQVKDGDDKGADDTTRFDQHPAWQRIIQERDALKSEMAELKTKVETVKPVHPTPPPPAIETLPYKDTSKMTREEIIEWFEDDPVGYQANLLAQAKHEVISSLKQEETQRSRIQTIEKTFNDYADKNPDFNKMWESGEIEKFMQANPGHNAISAHMIMTGDKKIQEATTKAAKEAEDKVIKNFQAKSQARVISEGGGIRAAGAIPVELKDTAKYGGQTSVLARNLEQRRMAGT